MTLADTTLPSDEPVSALPSRRHGLRWLAGILTALLLVAAGVVVSGTYYYDSVTVPPLGNPRGPVVSVVDLPAPVVNAFVAAVDPDFYEDGSGATPLSASLLTRRYLTIASGSGAESSWRNRVMAHKAESQHTDTEILDFYLNSADYRRGAVGLVAAAQTYFGKRADQLTVAEAALLAVQLHPGWPEPKAGWAQVLDTMVEHGWLSQAERDGLTFPA